MINKMPMSPFTLQIHHVGGRDGELGEFPLNPNFSKAYPCSHLVNCSAT